MDVLVSHSWQNDEPLLQEFGSKSVIGACVSEIHYQLKWFMTKGFEGQNDMVNEKISISFADFVSASNVVKHWMTSP